MPALPSNVSYCTVTGKFVSFVGDSADADRYPDATAMEGLTIRFRPSVATVTNENAVPPVTIVTNDIVCTTDPTGVLLGPDGMPTVLLVASDDPDLKPHGWTYNVTVSGTGLRTIAFDFVAPSGGTIDLATVVPVPSNPGAQISAWQAVTLTVTDARDQTIEARNTTLQAIEDFEPEFSGVSDDITQGMTNLFMTSAEKSKLSGVATGATANAADSALRDRSTHTGTQAISTVTNLQTTLDAKVPATRNVAGKPLAADVSLVKADVGLSNVDNTSDASKPVSTATQTALNAKADSSAVVALTGAQTIAGVKTFSSAPVVPDGSFAQTKVTGLPAALDAKVGSPNSSVTGVAYYATEGDLPATGTTGVLYIVGV